MGKSKFIMKYKRIIDRPFAATIWVSIAPLSIILRHNICNAKYPIGTILPTNNQINQIEK